jgi:N-acetylneuraminic acid mutarotase
MAACTSDKDDDDTGDPPDSGEPPDAGDQDTGVVDMGTVTSKCDPPGAELPAGMAPMRRGDMAFAYDTNCDRVIMFHGDEAEPLNCGFAGSAFITDGWVFDPARGTWAEIPDQAGDKPLPRARAGAVWDPNGNKMILFGGRWRPAGSTGAYTFLNDIWAYDPSNNTWELLGDQTTPNAPSGRMNMVVVMDPERNRVLVHDGGITDFQTFTIDPGVWAFDLGGRTWTKQPITGPTPPPRLFHTAALDKMRSRLYIYGGGGEDAFTGPFYGDTWYLDLNALTWTQVTGSPAPEGRIKGVMDYDEARDRIVLFAGHDNSQLGNNNDLWVLTLDTLLWERRPGGDVFNRDQFGFCDFPADFATVDDTFPERRESHVFVIHEDRAFMFGGRTDCGLANDTWYLHLPDTTWENVNESFTGMTCFRSGRTDCNDPQARKCG